MQMVNKMSPATSSLQEKTGRKKGRARRVLTAMLARLSIPQLCCRRRTHRRLGGSTSRYSGQQELAEMLDW